MSVTLHTTKGDLKILLLQPHLTPKTSYNFLAHCAKGTYDNTNIVRNLPGLMIQLGDPTNTGKGGESIWGGVIEDEIIEIDEPEEGKKTLKGLKFDKRGMVAMCQMPSTSKDGIKKGGGNGSQFFITYDAFPSMNGKYTIFGQCVEDPQERMNGTSTLCKLESVLADKKGKVKNEREKLGIKDVTIHANPFAENLVRSK